MPQAFRNALRMGFGGRKPQLPVAPPQQDANALPNIGAPNIGAPASRPPISNAGPNTPNPLTFSQGGDPTGGRPAIMPRAPAGTNRLGTGGQGAPGGSAGGGSGQPRMITAEQLARQNGTYDPEASYSLGFVDNPLFQGPAWDYSAVDGNQEPAAQPRLGVNIDPMPGMRFDTTGSVSNPAAGAPQQPSGIGQAMAQRRNNPFKSLMSRFRKGGLFRRPT